MTALAESAHPALRLAPVSLREAEQRAGLQTRVDAKYLVDPVLFAEFTGRLDGAEWQRLEVGGGWMFRYSSVYFDTPDLLTFRQHRQGRRRRFKIRTRHYADTGDCTLEVKLRGGRQDTVKRRLDYRAEDRRRLDSGAVEFVGRTLAAAYSMRVPQGLAASAETSYRRMTLVRRDGTARVTCDTSLVFRRGARTAAAAPLWLVETKSAAGAGPADRLLWSLGARPLRLSKYCLAVAVCHPEVPVTPWRPALRRLFPGWG